jgi:hypothetical protein
LAFLSGVYLLGASYGTHEVTNYLHQRFCLDDSSTMCRIVAFNDDEFSHWVFFTGFLLVNVSLLWLQVVFPQRGPVTGRDTGLLVVNGATIGLGVFANLAFEVIGLDLTWWVRWRWFQVAPMAARATASGRVLPLAYGLGRSAPCCTRPGRLIVGRMDGTRRGGSSRNRREYDHGGS